MEGITIVYGIVQILIIFILLKVFSKKLFELSENEKKLYTNEVTIIEDENFVQSYSKFYI